MKKKYIPFNLVRNNRTNLLGPDFDLQKYIKDVVAEELLAGTFSLPAIATVTGTVADNNDAATTGVAVYLHIDEKDQTLFGHLEFVSPTNASTTFRVGASGPYVKVNDDDAAATGGYQVYFDEDATDADSRFLVNNALTGSDIFVVASDGKLIRFKHNAAPGTPGVAVYLDEDAASAHLKLLFVSPTNANGTFTTDDSVTFVKQ